MENLAIHLLLIPPLTSQLNTCTKSFLEMVPNPSVLNIDFDHLWQIKKPVILVTKTLTTRQPVFINLLIRIFLKGRKFDCGLRFDGLWVKLSGARNVGTKCDRVMHLQKGLTGQTIGGQFPADVQA